jgi:cytochrome c-type biogenesis protein CcmH
MIYLLAFLAVAIASAALWFLVSPLARATGAESREEYFQLIGVRDRLLAQLNELDLEERDRNMDRDTAADERRRLENELARVLKRLEALAPVANVTKTHARSKQRWHIVMAVLVVAVPSVTVGVYMFNVTVPITRLAQAAAQTPPRGMPLDPREMVARLEARLQQNPDDFAGWIRLGRSYSVLGRFPDSKRAYARAYPLMPKDYRPDTPEALLFLGFAAAEAGHSQRALQYWNALLVQMPPDSPMTKELKRIIEETKQKSARKG